MYAIRLFNAGTHADEYIQICSTFKLKDKHNI